MGSPLQRPLACPLGSLKGIASFLPSGVSTLFHERSLLSIPLLLDGLLKWKEGGTKMHFL